jgi:hypothetical protein
MKIIVLIIVSSLLFSERDATAMTPEDVSVDPQAVVMPAGRVLLIKRNDFLGAIKFVRNEIRKDGVYSQYEYYEYEQGEFLKKRDDVIFRKVSKKGFWHNLRGLFFHGIPELGRIKLKSFVLFADAVDESHSTIYFWRDEAAKPDIKIQLAPTHLKNISQVNLNNKKIRWFGFDEKRERIITPIDRIWD